MDNISRTHTRCVYPITSLCLNNKIPKYDPQEELNRAVESIMDTPEVKETLEQTVSENKSEC